MEDVPILAELGKGGIDVVTLFCVGKEQADLDVLSPFTDSGASVPDKSVIVMNAGLVSPGVSLSQAFNRVLASKAH